MCLTGATGDPINEMGKGTFNFKLHETSLEKELIVADIEDDCLLAVDILQNGADGPTYIILSKGVIVMNDVVIPIAQTGIEKLRRVITADHYVIPGLSEVVIDVLIDRRENDNNNSEVTSEILNLTLK